MAKDAYWFKHDSNARMDERILELRAEHGWEGYGIYWGIVETLREQTDYRYSINRLKGLAMAFGIDAERLDEIVKCCIELDLFTLDNDVFYSPSLCRRMADWDEKRESNRRAAEIGWEKRRNADAMQMHNECNADAMPIREEKRREEKKRVENTYTDAFELFWKAYPKERRVGKGAAFKIWKREKLDYIVESIVESVNKYRETAQWKKEGGQFIPHPSTFLNQKRYDDEPKVQSSGRNLG